MRYVFGTLVIALAALTSSSAALTAAQRGASPASAASPQTAASASPASPSSTSSSSSGRALLDQYCVACHNQRAKTANLMFDTLDVAKLSEHTEIWEKAIVKLRGGLMPPPGSKQPDPAAVNGFISWLETSLDKAAAAAPNPGTVSLHRLNRVEYANSIRELFAIDVDASALLPTDDVSDGFDNIANVLKVSPSFLDQYISAARAVTRQAIGEPRGSGARITLRPTGAELNPYGPGGLPLGTQGTLAEYVFPADGEYEFGGGRGNANSVITIDGVKVPAGGRIAVKAGPHKVGVPTAPRGFLESEATLQAFGAGGGAGGRGGGGGGGGLQVTGPYNPTTPVADTPSRERIFVCRPANETEELGCATKILSNVSRRAFRRPVTDKDLEAPLAFFKDGRTTGGNFEAGVQLALMTIIASPKFLYRMEQPPVNSKLGAIYKISDLDLASRLSFALWSQIPDDSLLDLAIKGRLSDPAVLDQQVKKMLLDPRSKALVTNFAFQWLKVREAERAEPDTILFPNFDNGLRQAFRREMELFIDSVKNEDRSVVDLLSADYTFVNERLAAHYGIPNIRGAEFRKVTLADSNRWGLLGKGALLMVTSQPNRTSPVLRGAWILENITGTPPSAPPPDVEGFRENKEGEKARTVRELMEAHRANPSCNACHGVMDPLGFALENFDAVGEWRTKDRFAGTAIDASGKLVNGTTVSGPGDLRQALLKHPDQFVQTMTEKLMMYALGRSVESYDMPAVRKIVRDSARDNYRFSSIVLGVVKSAPFQMKKVSE